MRLAVITFLVSMAVTSCALPTKTTLLSNYDVAFSDGQVDTPQQMRGYILAGALRFRDVITYQVDSDTNGEIGLTLLKGAKHSATILIPYNEKGFQIKYRNSYQLDYAEQNGERLIHSAYRRWLDELIKEIKISRQLRLNEKGEPIDKQLASYLAYSSSWKGVSIATVFEENSLESKLESRKSELTQKDGYIVPQKVNVRGKYYGGNVTCGPICYEFEAEGGKRYFIDWEQETNKCRLVILDMTGSGIPTPLPRKQCSFTFKPFSRDPFF